MENPNEYAIKEIEKFERRTKNNIKRLVTACVSTGTLAASSIVFGILGLNSVARREFIGKSLGYGTLTLLCASFATYAFYKAYNYYCSLNNKIEIYSDMAEDQFVQKLQK